MRIAALLLFVFAACGTVDLDVVTPLGAPCAKVDECGAGQLCERAACGDALGRCVERPTSCDGEQRPECGCDGIQYWNACLRRKAGVESQEPGPCATPLRCDDSTPCPAGASCGFLVFPGQCGPALAGACLVVPDTCEGRMGEHFYACDDTRRTQCLDACQAVGSGQPMERFRGPCP